jgi:hypothetical protein
MFVGAGQAACPATISGPCSQGIQQAAQNRGWYDDPHTWGDKNSRTYKIVKFIADWVPGVVGAGPAVRRFAGPLVPGLPSEFAQAALDGLVRCTSTWHSGGLLVVDRGAYDEVDSSPVAFEIAGGLLGLALLAELEGTKLDASALEQVLR